MKEEKFIVKRKEHEIKLFYKEIRELIDTAENIPNPYGIRFDPFLFMLWRNLKK